VTEGRPVVRVVDDDASFLAAVSRLLRAAGHPVETYPSAAALLEALPSDPRGCIVTDLRMPGMDGLELQERLVRRGFPLPVVFLSGHGDVPAARNALKLGAEDFLTKTAKKEELLDAVSRALARGEAEGRERQRLRALRQQFETLTQREREVLAHVVQGRLNKQIAARLSLHERTVKLHRTSLSGKLGVSGTAELTRWAQGAGVLAELDLLAGGPSDGA
jgi:two-component system, LuxR family, response regulator FixJ